MSNNAQVATIDELRNIVVPRWPIREFCRSGGVFAIADSTGRRMLCMKSHPLLLSIVLAVSACAGAPPAHDAHRDGGRLWVKYAAEYRALTEQVYATATLALPGFVADTSWSAMPGQRDAGHLPAAVILDVDETVVSNVDFQLTYEPPFANWKLDEWTRSTVATPVSGVKAFVDAARARGVEIFFVTNRPCEPVAGNADPCPQKQSTLDDIAEVGIDTDADHVLLSEERGWNREKLARREYVAATHRVIMLIGDDLGDFIPCIRNKAYAPCTTAASAADRLAMVDEHAHMWGNGWYILPNPMHGSWTSAVPR